MGKLIRSTLLFSTLLGCTFGEDCPVKLTDTDGAICFGTLYETGGELEEYFYDEDGYALLIPASSDLAQKIVDDGLFIPHGVGSCENPKKPWTAFSVMGTEIQIACCEELGCQWEFSPTTSFGICYPEEAAWGNSGMIGAIARLDSFGVPQCEELEPLAFVYDYVYPVFCHEVACEKAKDECGCRCVEDHDCSSIDSWLGNTYFGGASLPSDLGWESACTGTPYWWDPQAYGSGGYVGGSCEFNQGGISPLIVEPSVITKIKSLVSCERNNCLIHPSAIQEFKNFPQTSLEGTNFIFHEDGTIEIESCGDLCQHLGGFEGLTITSFGGRDIFSASREFESSGFMRVETDVGEFTFTIEENMR